MVCVTGVRSHKVLTPALLAALLLHCSLESDGLGPGGQAGTGGSGPAGTTGAGGETNGAGGSESGAGGVGGVDTGGGGGTDGAGGGMAGVAGAPGGMGGGTSGQGGSGGEPVDCDEGRDEFTVPGEPGSCFFLMHATSKARPASKRTSWKQDQADVDCQEFDGARLGGADTLLAYGQVANLLNSGVYGTITSNVWLGATTSIAPEKSTPEDLAPSFEWLNGDPWGYTSPSSPPWGAGEPSTTANEICTQMRSGAFSLSMNNSRCDLPTGFVLCERKPPPRRGRRPKRW